MEYKPQQIRLTELCYAKYVTQEFLPEIKPYLDFSKQAKTSL
jgi:hypothetical protein